MSRLVPSLWYAEKAEEAAAYYASLMPDSRVDRVTTLPSDRSDGAVKVVEFTLMNRPFVALGAGPLDNFNHSVSLMIECDDQAEIDRLWSALSQGGAIERCGWLQDRFGLFWQIVPACLGKMMNDPDPSRSKRVAEAMLKMGKLDIGTLQEAYEGGEA